MQTRFLMIAICVLATLLDLPCAAKEPVTATSVVLRLLDEADAPAMSAGVLQSVEVREGDRVSAGQSLAVLDDARERIALQAAEIELKIARHTAEDDVPLRAAAKTAEAAAAELRRSEESIEKFARSISQSQIDVERLTLEQAELEHERAGQEQRKAQLQAKLLEKRVEAAKTELMRRKIVSPLDGVVVESLVRRGEWLEPGQKAFRVVRIDRLKAEGFITADQASPNLIGATALISAEGANENGAVRGVVVFVSPEVDPINGQVRVWAEAPNADGALRPGDRVRMTLEPKDSAEDRLSQSRGGL